MGCDPYPFGRGMALRAAPPVWCMINPEPIMLLPTPALTTLTQLPKWVEHRTTSDWLITRDAPRSGVFRTDLPNEIVLSNGLVARHFLLGDLGSTVGISDLRTGAEWLRGPLAEAEFTLDGRAVRIGGVEGQPNLAYLLDDWRPDLRPTASPLKFVDFEVGAPTVATPYKPGWHPKGTSLTLWFADPDSKVGVHYEIYDGLPVIGKWLTYQNLGSKPVRIDAFKSEMLRFVEGESNVDNSRTWNLPNVSLLTDYSFGGMSVSSSNQTAYWLPDPAYTTQVNYALTTPCVLEMRPPTGPSVDVPPHGQFATFRTYELFHDSTDRERKGLALRTFYRTLAPWTQDNPLMLHLTSTDPATVRTAIDQAAECGFEMVIFSFGSGLDMEDVSPANIARFRAFREYANAKGLRLGGYSLLASRRIDDASDVIDPKTGQPDKGAVFGASPCLGSAWGERYFEHLKKFMTETGFQLLEHDGSYPGDLCASTTHPGHRGLDDSQWTQYRKIADFYRWAREHDIFLNVPDNYFLAGSNKTGMGYRETNWSLPRLQQHIHARQNLFDGTWEKTPSMGWMMVPLVEYQGGGAAATIEPLHEHLHDYEMHLANNLGYGAQACYRGSRLYDTEATKQAVIKWVTWFKAHRAILESDIIHVNRADGRNLDAALHVNPRLETKAMAVVYNPTNHPLTQEIVLPLYYSGLTDRARLSIDGGLEQTLPLDREYRLVIKPTVPANSCVWITLR